MSRAACLNNGKSFLVSRAYDITSIVDRVGSGDSFAGGLLYGMQMLADDAAALELAAALSCLKHSTYGDFSRARLAEVNSPLKDGGSGRVQR
jgi:2-dehydro-3-deoxygluconokinase